MNRKICDAIRLLLVFGTMLGVFSGAVSAAPEQTTTGFVYPTGQKEPYIYSGWLAGGPGIVQKYQSDLYHTGQDIEGTPDITRVLAISDGEIIYVSTGGWNYGTGTGNYGLFVKHKLNTGEEFLALYGHIKPDDERLKCSTPCNVNPPIKVYAGVAFGTVGPYNTIPHLHFGIHPGATIPSGRLGNMVIKDSWYGTNGPDTNGFVNPIDWIKTRQPAGSVPITSWSFNTPGDKEGWEAHYVESSEVGTDGRYRINPSIDPWIQYDGLSLNSNNYNAIEINMASNAPDGMGKIYFVTASSPIYDENKHIDFSAINDGNWRTYTVYMKNHPYWSGTITGLRIDPATQGKPGADNTDIIGIDWIKVVSSQPTPTASPTITPPSSPPYSSFYEGSVVTGNDISTPNWWLKDGFKRKITDSATLQSILGSNGNKYWGFSSADINKIPQGADITIAPPYSSFYEGSVVNSGVTGTPNWWLKDGFKRKITDSTTLQNILSSNGGKFWRFSSADIDKIPQGADITITAAYSSFYEGSVVTGNDISIDITFQEWTEYGIILV